MACYVEWEKHCDSITPRFLYDDKGFQEKPLCFLDTIHCINKF